MIHPEAGAPTVSVEQLRERRDALRELVGSGVIVIPGHDIAWRNADNPYPFRQNSHLLYLAPVHRSGVVLMLDADSGEDLLFAAPEDPDDVVWHGPQPSLADQAAAVGVREVRDLPELPSLLSEVRKQDRHVHFTPPIVPEVGHRLAAWLGLSREAVDAAVSGPLVLALGELRLRKSANEIREIERALEVTAEMFDVGMRMARPGAPESAVRGAMAHVGFAHGFEFSFAPIVTVRGEVLHNDSYRNVMQDGDLLLIDAGLETPAGYASDISRTIPVAGAFSTRQRALYEIVLAAQETAIESMRVGVSFRHVHDRACRAIASGLIDLGLMRGAPDEAVAAGAHALFFVHGLGHPLGLDVHDLHDLGDSVAYSAEQPRSSRFGTAFLRFGRELEAGMVMTVEPGIYFIPPLIDSWRAEGRSEEFIVYDEVERFRDVGGIRIEDDVLVTDDGVRELGPGIPRSVPDVEAVAGNS